MPSHNVNSRRNFLYNTALASLGIACAGQSAWASRSLRGLGIEPDSKIKGVQLGVITYSFRSMPGSVAQVLQYCVDANISAIELMGPQQQPCVCNFINYNP